MHLFVISGSIIFSKNVREGGEKLAHEVALLGPALVLPPLILKAAHDALLLKLKESDVQGFAI